MSSYYQNQQGIPIRLVEFVDHGDTYITMCVCAETVMRGHWFPITIAAKTPIRHPW